MTLFRQWQLAMLFLLSLSLPAHAALQVVSLSTILTELAQQVGGDKVAVIGLVKAGVDPHDFEPSPEDMKAMGAAQLVLATGKGLESYLSKVKAAAPGVTFVEVGNALPSLRLKDDEAGATIEDPHWWNSVPDMEKAVPVVRDALTKLDPADAAYFAARAGAYESKLAELDRWARLQLAALPRDRRVLVTSHDAFQYFARDYHFKLCPIEGVSPEEEPSSRRVIELMATIRAQQVKAVFFENIENPKVITEITRETGAKVGGELYADGLGTGDASTYVGMFRHNIETMVKGLQ